MSRCPINNLNIKIWVIPGLFQKQKYSQSAQQQSCSEIDFHINTKINAKRRPSDLDFWISAIAVSTILINSLQTNVLQAWGTALAFRSVKTMKGAEKKPGYISVLQIFVRARDKEMGNETSPD